MASPAANVTYCHPSYAQSTEIIAAPAAVRIDPDGAVSATAVMDWPLPMAIRIALIARMAPTLIPVAQFAPTRARVRADVDRRHDHDQHHGDPASSTA